MPASVDAWRVLAGMTKNGLPFLLLGIGNVYEVSGMEAHGLFASTNLKKIQRAFIRRPYPGLDGEQTGALMILVRIDGPVRKY